MGIAAGSHHHAYALVPIDEEPVSTSPIDVEMISQNSDSIVVRVYNESTDGIVIINNSISHNENSSPATWDYSEDANGVSMNWTYSIEIHSYDENKLKHGSTTMQMILINIIEIYQVKLPISMVQIESSESAKVIQPVS